MLVLASALLASCSKDLDIQPKYDVTAEQVYSNPANYKNVLAKLYSGLALSGQQGPAGQPDITGIDEGFSTYLRQYWQLQELTTDEAVIGWNDAGLPDLHNLSWTSSNQFVTAMYNRLYYQIGICNEFIRQTTDAKLASRNITGSDLDNAKKYRAEARFLRALSYYHALDMYGNVPFVTEEDEVGAIQPEQIMRPELFAYVESELLAISGDNGELVNAKQNEYGRADKAAAWALLAKLYLNAQVYTGQAKYTEAITYCNKVIEAAYSLSPQYLNLFLADNNTSPEMIFTVNFDGVNSRTYGGMTFLVHGEVGGKMDPAAFGIDGGWGGQRTTKALVSQFSDPSGSTDKRALFFTDGQSLEINDISLFTDGYAITKYRNITSAGKPGSDPTKLTPDTDYPMLRLGDVYLMYAEAVLRGGAGGSAATALQYVNALRQRAYGDATGNITAASLTLDFILAERARELYWEGTRRTDLIRFGRFTTAAYLWPYKGGARNGRAVSDDYNLFPIPSTDIIANPKLKQNPGY
ncbi:RagB/SusD family nutrient uptake outer membrane protein [Hymenobacter cavernae]|nr:RagB/SusD family nutrient uptake outer membrane protein [Hymenobacter cavernae]